MDVTSKVFQHQDQSDVPVKTYYAYYVLVLMLHCYK